MGQRRQQHRSVMTDGVLVLCGMVTCGMSSMQVCIGRVCMLSNQQGHGLIQIAHADSEVWIE